MTNPVPCLSQMAFTQHAAEDPPRRRASQEADAWPGGRGSRRAAFRVRNNVPRSACGLAGASPSQGEAASPSRLHSRRIAGGLLLVAVLAGSLGPAAPAAFAEPLSALEATSPPPDAAAPVAGVLHLANKGFARGRLLPTAEAGRLRWQSPAFTQPFNFAISSVADVQFPVLADRPQPQGRYCLELVGGDVLFGDLESLDQEHLRVAVARVGVVSVRRDLVHRWYRWKQGGQLVYMGPNGLNGWKQTPENSWSDVGGHIGSLGKPGYVQGDVRLPPQAAVEFELTWKSTPQFTLALGVSDNDSDQSYKHAHRFEIWDSELVIRCESQREADVDTVTALSSGAGRASYIAYLDQIQGRMLVYSADRGKLAEIQVTPTKAEAKPGIRLAVKKGDLRLERLRITEWDGLDPQGTDAQEARVMLLNGNSIRGPVTAFDRAAGQFTIQGAEGPVTVAVDEVSGVSSQPKPDDHTRSFRVVYQDGTRLSGELRSISERQLVFEHPALVEPLSLPQNQLQSLVVLNPRAGERPAAPAGRTGRLELEGTTLFGALIPGAEQPGSSCLTWLPDDSSEGSSLHPDQRGRIVYREPPPPAKSVTSAAPRANAFGGIFIRRAVPATPSKNLTTPTTSRGPGLHLFLRTGDAITYESAAIREDGVMIKTAFSDATFVPHAKIKALELAPGAPPKLSKIKRERLLMLPRLQKDSPPTQLICSKTGDILRGRVIDMNQEQVRVEIRLDTKELPRERISQIIWLHPDEAPPDSKTTSSTTAAAAPAVAADPAVAAGAVAAEAPAVAETPAVSFTGTRVQALHSDGIRLTFWAEAFADNSLSGRSEVLGACRADVALLDQLLFGDAIESAAAELAYQQWKLHPAIEPKIAQDLGTSEDGGLSGLESALVGKPAPDFQLNLLDGGKFQLSEQRGRVVVLDFWATWCGPCLQSLPMVHGVAEEFSDKGLQLIAVNLEEPVKQIKATLERHKLPLTVALDRDGVVATKYEAQAIPQTVVIDQEGKIVRLFVGGGPQLGDELRKVLQELTTAKP
ncbi:MAG: TlpA disulfide reductase family protein [Planctomycetaceae bacterium]|nr:TlpA disulfide reductase family protein [Planctomycetaceae bacterium]